MKTTAASPSTHLQSLRVRIAAVRSKRTLVKAATGVAYAVAVVVGAFTTEAALDELVELPWIARALIFAATVAGAAYLLWRETIRPLCRRLPDDQVALMIEHDMPIFRTRFIASLQLGRAAGQEPPHSLVRALLAETAAMASTLTFRFVVKTAKLKRLLLITFAIVAAASALAWFCWPSTVILLKRVLLSTTQLPRKTHILTVTGDRKIGVGEDLTVQVTASGVLPPGGQVITNVGAVAREFALVADPAQPGKYSAVIQSPQESFNYYVKLNDDKSQTYHVETILRPAVGEVAFEQTYPTYANLPPVKRTVGDLTLLAGSRLKVSIKASMKIGKGSAYLVGLNKELPLTIDPKDQTSLTGEIEIPPKDLTGFSVHLASPEGVVSGTAATYRIDVQPDREPTVKITYPDRREELATSLATLRIGVEGKDDFGIAKMALHYSIDQGAEKTIEFDLEGSPEKEVKRRFEWKLSSLQPRLALGSVIEFWVTATDCNNMTGPGVGTSEHNEIKIVSDDEKRLDIANRVRDTMSGVSDVAASQEDLNKILGGVIFEKPKQTP